MTNGIQSKGNCNITPLLDFEIPLRILRVAWFSVDIIIGFLIVLFLIVRSNGEISEFLVIFLVHFLEFSDQAFVNIVMESFPFWFLPLGSPFIDSVG